MVDRVGSGFANVEPSAVVAHFTFLVEVFYLYLAERLVVLGEVSLHISLQTVSLLVVATAKSLSDGRYALVGIGRVHFHVAGFARP